MPDLIRYNSKDYKVRTFEVEVLSEGYEAHYTIASESLIDDMRLTTKNESEDFNPHSVEYAIDGEIYHYIEDKLLDLSAIEICEKHLDMPMRFIREVN
jgi:hypothetical protein